MDIHGGHIGVSSMTTDVYVRYKDPQYLDYIGKVYPVHSKEHRLMCVKFAILMGNGWSIRRVSRKEWLDKRPCKEMLQRMRDKRRAL